MSRSNLRRVFGEVCLIVGALLCGVGTYIVLEAVVVSSGASRSDLSLTRVLCIALPAAFFGVTQSFIAGRGSAAQLAGSGRIVLLLAALRWAAIGIVIAAIVSASWEHRSQAPPGGGLFCIQKMFNQ